VHDVAQNALPGGAYCQSAQTCTVACPSTTPRRGDWKLIEFHEDNTVGLYTRISSSTGGGSGSLR